MLLVVSGLCFGGLQLFLWGIDLVDLRGACVVLVFGVIALVGLVCLIGCCCLLFVLVGGLCGGLCVGGRLVGCLRWWVLV